MDRDDIRESLARDMIACKRARTRDTQAGGESDRMKLNNDENPGNK